MFTITISLIIGFIFNSAILLICCCQQI